MFALYCKLWKSTGLGTPLNWFGIFLLSYTFFSCQSDATSANDGGIYTAPTDSLANNTSPAPSEPISPRAVENPIAEEVGDLDPTELLLLKGESEVYKSLNQALLAPEQVFILDLSSQYLPKFPEKILELPNLEELYLSNNLISRLPDSLAARLGTLKTLDLSNNRFQSLPAVIFQLPALQYLNLSRNQLTRLPSEIVQLQSLKILNLRGNRFPSFPEEILQLGNLEYLYLEGINLRAFPASLEGLSRLSRLSLDQCQLQEIPDAVLNKAGLKQFSIRGNQLSQLPPELSLMRELEHLSLDQNKLNGDLKPLFTLKRLHTLSMAQNPLSVLVAQLFEEISLKALNLDNCQLSEIPSTIGQSESLVWLSIKGNPLLALPTSMNDCQRLRVLRMGGHGEMNLDQALRQLSALPNLRYLELSSFQGNKQNFSLPESITSLKNLTILDLRGNQMGDIPSEVQKLSRIPSLEALNLSNCGLRKAFPEMESLQSLKILGLDIARFPSRELQNLFIYLPAGIQVVDGHQYFDYFNLTLN